MTDGYNCRTCGSALNRNGLCPVCSVSSSPASGASAPSYMVPELEGSAFLGFVLGFVLGLWGLVGALVLGKPATKSGAIKGFVARLVAVGVVVVAAVAFGGTDSSSSSSSSS